MSNPFKINVDWNMSNYSSWSDQNSKMNSSNFCSLFAPVIIILYLYCPTAESADYREYHPLIPARGYFWGWGNARKHELLPQNHGIGNKGVNRRPVVTIGDGRLQGFITETVSGRKISAFQNIPFARPPVGPWRFRDPVKNQAWRGTRDASGKSPVCIQMDFVQNMRIHGQEDCLYLNVYVPQQEGIESLPVMVFIHGGGFYYGAGSIYGPRYLLDQQNVILVTFNYRLGPFGFFSTGDNASPGNQGLKDQLLALKWVQTNIEKFNGNKNLISIFGQSAGSGAVGLHIVSPASRGLFHQAITESGSSVCYWSSTNTTSAAALAARVGNMFNCTRNSPQDMVECLRNVPPAVLASARSSFVDWYGPLVIFNPTVEHDHPGAFLTKTPTEYYENGEAAPVKLIAGINTDEGAWRVASFINNTHRVNQINSEWELIGPTFLGLDIQGSSLEGKEKLAKIWDYYMHGKMLSWDTTNDFVTLYSDRYINECSLKGIRYHSMYTNQSVYAYQFSYKGRKSGVQIFGGRPQDWGVSHFDEVIYLLDNPEYLGSDDLTGPDLEMSRLLVTMWSNFARYGIPFTTTGPGGVRAPWKPITPATDEFSPLQLFDINLHPKMIKDPYEKRYKFWRQTINANP